MDNNIYTDVAIVGAGAAGLMAAYAASAAPGARRLRVTVFERNDRPGRKLSITGKGRCNITNSAEKEQFMRNIPGNGKFLFSAFSKMSNNDIVSFFNRVGVETTLERGGRYFTKSGSAREVTDKLVCAAESNGANILCGARVMSIRLTAPAAAATTAPATAATSPAGPAAANAPAATAPAATTAPATAAPASHAFVTVPADGAGRRFALRLKDGRTAYANCVILATGGVTYPSTGSTGDGYKFAAAFGHTIIAPRPSLVPLETVEQWPSRLSGLTLKNVSLSLYSPGGKKLFSKLGEMLFTHFGVSGPLVLSGSRALLDCGFAGCAAKIDLKPGLSDEKLRARIARDFEFYAKKQLANAMADLLPARLIPVVIEYAGLEPALRADRAGAAGVAKLSETLKNLPLSISAARPPDEAIVTAGGVRTDEINPAAMESKIVPDLYFCGELIDVDAYTGGFNLSIAFATGHVAGFSAAAALLVSKNLT